MVFLWILLGIAALVLLISYICYRIVFYAAPAKPLAPEEYDIPNGKAYEPHREQMITWQKKMRALPYESVSITSCDGLTLWGKYFECVPGGVTELMFHGYRGNAERDLCGGIQRAFRLQHNVLIVDQRTSGRSQGHTITFGIQEHKDCLDWIALARERFGTDTKLILTGISMGAATVLMAAGHPLPENVVGVLADCGYTSAKQIICKCAKQMGLPPKLVYPFIRLGAMVYGCFDPEEYSPIEAMKTCKVPVIFFHGDADDFVPCEMSWENYDACVAPKKLVVMRNADHGLCYIMEPERYLQELADFFSENGVATAVLPL